MTKHTIIYSEGFKNVQRIPKTKEEAYMTEKKTEKKERKPRAGNRDAKSVYAEKLEDSYKLALRLLSKLSALQKHRGMDTMEDVGRWNDYLGGIMSAVLKYRSSGPNTAEKSAEKDAPSLDDFIASSTQELSSL